MSRPTSLDAAPSKPRRVGFRAWISGFLAALGLLAAQPPAAAQLLPVGKQFQLNTYSTDHQWSPAISTLGPGGFVVVWASEGSEGTDTHETSIQAQRLDGQGDLEGPQFQVNTWTTAYQTVPAVAADAQGRFVVTWSSFGSYGTDHSGYSVQIQRYAADGSPIGGELQVNTYTTGGQMSSQIAMSATGEFVVVWSSEGSYGTDISETSIQAKLFDSDGVPVGDALQVNEYTTGPQYGPSVTMDDDGRFVVAWYSEGSYGTDPGWSVQARRFDASGIPLGSQFQVNTYTTGAQWSPAIAMDGLHQFVIAWTSRGSGGTDTSGYSVQARRFDAAGAALGDEFQVNSYTTFDQYVGSVAFDLRNDFVVTWEHYYSGFQMDVLARGFRASGFPGGFEERVNSFTTGRQSQPVIASAPDGSTLVAWTSLGSTGTDRSGHSIQAQQYVSAFFYDGFESGDVSRWTLSVP